MCLYRFNLNVAQIRKKSFVPGMDPRVSRCVDQVLLHKFESRLLLKNQTENSILLEKKVEVRLANLVRGMT